MEHSREFSLRGILIVLSAAVILLQGVSLTAAQRRMVGPNLTMSWASTYLTINTDAVTVQNDAEWIYASAAGWFFDYQLNPFVSLRAEWFCYPSVINSNPFRSSDSIGEVNLHEIGFSVLRHFDKGYISPWFGAGPYMQFNSIGNINSYVVHILLSVGFDYELSDDLYFCPELITGVGASLIKSDNQTVQFDVPTGGDFSTSGIVVFLKLGFARTF